ncbi:MAG: glycoside hydrolase [Chloroflexi bacterium]|nr:glycoside hydrolase [Chloroflexota bacterium]
MASLTQAEHTLIYKDPFAYCAHPHIARLPDGEWVIVFNHTIRRPFILHPPNDPRYYNMLIRSTDEGKTWNQPRVTPGYDWHGVECAGLTVLEDGALLLNQWRFQWYPLETARSLAANEALSYPADWVRELKAAHEVPHSEYIPDDPAEYVPWARGNDGAYVHRSRDGGRTWEETIRLDTQPYSGGYGMRGGVQLPNGDILLPLSDAPNYRIVFVMRSQDGGRSWSAPVEAANQPGKEFEEPSIWALNDDRLLLLLRENQSHVLHQCFSIDGGLSWSQPTSTRILGYPAHLLRLPDGRLFCTYGYRYQPYSIRAVISDDEGLTWDASSPLIIRDDLPNRDLGYPATVLTNDGDLFTVYYAQDVDGVTCIWGTRYKLEG